MGESERALKTRLAEHKRPSSTTSPLVEHAKAGKQTFDWDNVSVLDQDSNWFNRGVREAINIRRHPSSLNRDKGRHELPAVYNRLIQPPKTPPTTVTLRHVTLTCHVMTSCDYRHMTLSPSHQHPPPVLKKTQRQRVESSM